MRVYLKPVVKADESAHYFNGVGIKVISAPDPTLNNRAVFDCIQNTTLELTEGKYHFGVEIQGRSITAERASPQVHKSNIFLSKLRFPTAQKTGIPIKLS